MCFMVGLTVITIGPFLDVQEILALIDHLPLAGHANAQSVSADPRDPRRRKRREDDAATAPGAKRYRP
jgi:hypothetical protein